MSEPIENRSFTLTRTYDAPRDLVFDAFTRPEHVDRWWGPDGFTTQTSAMNVVAGGEWRFTMAHAAYGTYPNRARYRLVIPNERLEYELDGGEDNDPGGFLATITFQTVGARTLVTMSGVLKTVEAWETAKSFGAVEMGAQNMAKLDAVLAADAEAELVIVRDLAASPAAVWKAWTEAEALAQWWGPKGFTMGVVRLDLRPGGTFLYSMTGAGSGPMSGEMWGKFVYSEVTPTERLAYVVSFTDADGNPMRHPLSATWPLEVYNLLTFEATESGTRLTLRGRPVRASAEDRATFAAAKVNVQQGFAGTFAQLVEYLARN